MGKKGRQKFTDVWANQTNLGKQFGLSSIAMGKRLKARELAESWVHVHKQWQEAIYGVEEELLIEEARDIKKEARRRGLTERVNALLRERKFDGDPIT
jgi:hypothetical protein